jgi:hypothetical protein
MSNQMRARPGAESELDDIEQLATQEFGRLKGGQESPTLAPATPAAQSIRKSATNPESFFFPVGDQTSRLRK